MSRTTTECSATTETVNASLKRALVALGIDPMRAHEGFRATHPFPVAVRLAALGSKMLPCNLRKIPRIELWQERASRDPRKLIQWERGLFASYKTSEPHPNWAILTGREGGAWIIDVDGPQGREDLARLEAELGPLPQTWTTESGRIGGGEHRWFKPTPESAVELMNQQHLFGYSIDVRAWHGYAVIPGSIHAKTRLRYRWRDGCAPDECEMAELPATWLEFLPKKMFGKEPNSSCSARSTRTRPSAPRDHDPTSLLIGDGPGFGGFQNAIYRNAIRYFFRAGVDAPESIITATLRGMIFEAPKDEGRDVSRYMGGNDLPRVVERAREFVKEVEDCEREEYEYTPAE